MNTGIFEKGRQDLSADSKTPQLPNSTIFFHCSVYGLKS